MESNNSFSSGVGIGFGKPINLVLALKPGVVKKTQICLMRFGIDPNSSIAQGTLPNPLSMQSGLSTFSGASIQNPLGSITQLSTQLPDQTSQGMEGYGNMRPHSSYRNATSTSSIVDNPFGSRTEKVITSFLQNPILNEENTNLNEVAGHLQSGNNLLQMLLKHQQVIEKLMEENEKLCQILVEDLKISRSKIQSSYSRKYNSPCADCFECQRKQRRR